jgi:hypothetical protein
MQMLFSVIDDFVFLYGWRKNNESSGDDGKQSAFNLFLVDESGKLNRR